MTKDFILGFTCGGLIVWVGKMIVDSNKETKKLIKKGETLAKEAEEVSTIAKYDFDSVEGSIQAARDVGVPEEKIIHNEDELDKFFLD